MQAVELGRRAGSVSLGLHPHRDQGCSGLLSCRSFEAVLALVLGSRPRSEQSSSSLCLLSPGLLVYKMEPTAIPGLPFSGTML